MLCYTLEMGLSGMDIVHILKEKDEDGNTPLHLAAISGLDNCVEVGGGSREGREEGERLKRGEAKEDEKLQISPLPTQDA